MGDFSAFERSQSSSKWCACQYVVGIIDNWNHTKSSGILQFLVPFALRLQAGEPRIRQNEHFVNLHAGLQTEWQLTIFVCICMHHLIPNLHTILHGTFFLFLVQFWNRQLARWLVRRLCIACVLFQFASVRYSGSVSRGYSSLCQNFFYFSCLDQQLQPVLGLACSQAMVLKEIVFSKYQDLSQAGWFRLADVAIRVTLLIISVVRRPSIYIVFRATSAIKVSTCHVSSRCLCFFHLGQAVMAKEISSHRSPPGSEIADLRCQAESWRV